MAPQTLRQIRPRLPGRLDQKTADDLVCFEITICDLKNREWAESYSGIGDRLPQDIADVEKVVYSPEGGGPGAVARRMNQLFGGKMSLTSQLKSGRNQVRLYFEENFPAKKNLKQELKNRIKDLPTILPCDRSSSYPWSFVGHAIDYRIRLYYEKYSLDDTVAKFGFGLVSESEIGKTEIDEEDLQRFIDKGNLWKELEEELESLTIDIVGERKPPVIERRLAQCCMALAYCEAQYRSGRLSEPLTVATTLGYLFSNMPEIVIEDLIQLFNAFYKSDKPSSNNIILNPTFSGSRDVGGADGDIILDHMLWEFKTTIDPFSMRSIFWPYQLIGYSLLDYDDRYTLKGCGTYLVRQSSWISWSFEELFDLLGSDPKFNISDHRKRFRISIDGSDSFKPRKNIKNVIGETPPLQSQNLSHNQKEKDDLMEKIRQLRKTHGLTLQEMADRLKVPEKEWNRIFNGDLRRSPIDTLREYIKNMENWSK